MRTIFSNALLTVGIALIGCKGDNVAGSTPSIARIIVTPKNPELAVGASVQLSAEGKGFDDKAGFLWRTTDQTILRVSSAGVVTGVAPGNARILTKAAFDTTLEVDTKIVVQ
jgi:hypothetical protein